MLSESNISSLESLPLVEALQEIAAGYAPGEVVFSSSLGQEDQVLTDAIFRNQIPIRIFSIDTGRLFNETYELLEKTTARYKKSIDLFSITRLFRA